MNMFNLNKRTAERGGVAQIKVEDVGRRREGLLYRTGCLGCSEDKPHCTATRKVATHLIYANAEQILVS